MCKENLFNQKVKQKNSCLLLLLRAMGIAENNIDYSVLSPFFCMLLKQTNHRSNIHVYLCSTSQTKKKTIKPTTTTTNKSENSVCFLFFFSNSKKQQIGTYFRSKSKFLKKKNKRHLID